MWIPGLYLHFAFNFLFFSSRFLVLSPLLRKGVGWGWLFCALLTRSGNYFCFLFKDWRHETTWRFWKWSLLPESVKPKGGARVTHTLQVLLKIHIKPANKKQQMMNVVKTMEDLMILTRCPLAPERYTAFQGRFQLESSRWELQNKAVVYGSIISDYIT